MTGGPYNRIQAQPDKNIIFKRNEKGDVEESEEEQFELVLNAILSLFAKDRQLLETRGSLIIRKLCVLLNAKSVYIRLANALMQYENVNGQPADAGTLEFVSTMVQTLNLILLTASELHDLRSILSKSFATNAPDEEESNELKRKQLSRQKKNAIEDSLRAHRDFHKHSGTRAGPNKASYAK